MDWLRSVLFRLLGQRAERGLRGLVDVVVHEHHVSAPSLREMSGPEDLAWPRHAVAGQILRAASIRPLNCQ